LPKFLIREVKIKSVVKDLQDPHFCKFLRFWPEPQGRYGSPNFTNFGIFQYLGQHISKNYKANQLKLGRVIEHQPI